MKRIVLTALGILIFAAGTARADVLSLRTYYPSPNGVYKRLQLAPRNPIVSTSCDLGVVYYNNTDDQIYLCVDDGSDGEWTPITGPQGAIWARNGNNIYPNSWADSAYTVGIGTSTPDPDSDVHVYNGNLVLGGYALSPMGSIELGGSTGAMFRLRQDDTPPNHDAWLLLSNDQGDGTYDQIMLMDGTNQNLRIGSNWSAVTFPLEIRGQTAGPTTDLHVSGYEGLLRVETRVVSGWDAAATLRQDPGAPSTCTAPCTDPDRQFEIRGANDALRMAAYRASGALLNTYFLLDAASGHVGIGEVTTPSAQLTVKGWGDPSSTVISPLAVLNADEDPLLYTANLGWVGMGTADNDLYGLYGWQLYKDDGRMIMATDPAGFSDPSVSIYLMADPDTTDTNFHINAGPDFLGIYSMDNDDPLGTNLQLGLGVDNTGNVSIRKNGADPGIELDVDGDVTYVAKQHMSDRRVKNNIQSLPPELENILQLRPVAFEYRNDEFPEMALPDGTSAGFIAQDIENVFPGLTSVDGAGYYRMGQMDIIPYLVKSIQDIKTEFDRKSQELIEDNRTLQDMITELERRLAGMNEVQP